MLLRACPDQYICHFCVHVFTLFFFGFPLCEYYVALIIVCRKRFNHQYLVYRHTYVFQWYTCCPVCYINVLCIWFCFQLFNAFVKLNVCRTNIRHLSVFFVSLDLEKCIFDAVNVVYINIIMVIFKFLQNSFFSFHVECINSNYLTFQIAFLIGHKKLGFTCFWNHIKSHNYLLHGNLNMHVWKCIATWAQWCEVA